MKNSGICRKFLCEAKEFNLNLHDLEEDIKKKTRTKRLANND